MPDQAKYQTVAADDLQLFEGNPRRGVVDEIAKSLQKLGQYRPLVVNAGTHTGRPMEVLAGNHTLRAIRQLGWAEADIRVVDVDEQSARTIVAGDNRLGQLGGFDDRELYALLDGIDDLDGTGYADDDVEALRRDLFPPEPLTDRDDVPDLPTADPVSEVGQLWVLGEHRLLVGSATDLEGVQRLCGDVRPDVVWTDPPYGVNYVGGTGMTIQNDSSEGLGELLDAAFQAVAAVARPGAPVYVAHADTERVTFECSLLAAGLIVRQNLVWVKNALVMGRSDYHYQHEPVLLAEVEVPDDDEDHQPILYGFTAGGSGRLGRGGERWYGDNKQSTVFAVPKPTRNPDHPTMKPVALIDAMLANSLPPGGVVLDPFSGSGSTLIAAHGRQSRAFCVELDPKYADVILRRFQAHTGVVPTLDGEPVSFLAAA